MDCHAIGGARASLGGAGFAIPEPAPFGKKWLSRKFEGPGLKYEIGLCAASGRIAWAYGPPPCRACSDLATFRKGMKLALASEEMVIGG